MRDSEVDGKMISTFGAGTVLRSNVSAYQSPSLPSFAILSHQRLKKVAVSCEISRNISVVRVVFWECVEFICKMS